MVAKPTEPYAYNQFDHNLYPDHTNAINVIKKQSNYNLYSNTYNFGWRDHSNFSWSHIFQQGRIAAPVPSATTSSRSLNLLATI